MENEGLLERLLEGARLLELELELDLEVAKSCLRLYEELIRWNRKMNLTAITQPEEVVEKHLLDSLSAGSFVQGAHSLLDLGAGAGFPSLPLALLFPELKVTPVDSVGKKVAFMKQAGAILGLGSRWRPLHTRASGSPELERIPLSDRVISRALMDLRDWLSLARHYLLPGGEAVAMLGQKFSLEQIRAAASSVDARLVEVRQHSLPFSRAERTLASFSWAR